MALPQLPAYVPKATIVRQQETAVQRATAETINRVDTNPTKQLTLSGANRRVPVVYGEVRTSGVFIAGPVISSGDLVFAIAWSFGPCEGVQTIYVNEETAPGGMTVTHYNGEPGQTPDPTLAAAIPGFTDAFDGIAYSVFVFESTSNVTGWPRVEAIFRGKKIFDPRTGLTEWTENPSLFISDFVQNATYGPGLPISGVAACADYNDTIYFGEPRARAGYTLSEGNNLAEVLGVMSAYADCLWHYNGNSIRLIPDTVVDGPAIVLTRSEILENTMRIRTVSTANTPTVVVVNWLRESGNASAWTMEASRQVLPGVGSGDLEEIESSVNLPGVRRELEAARKGAVRLNRLRFSGKYSWQAPDSGIRFQHGDVVQLPNYWGLTDQLVRIMEVQTISQGRYQVEAEHYDPAMYHDQVLPETPDSPVYEGLIFPFQSSEVPEGWEAYDDANGYYLKCCDDDTIAIGETGGEAQITGWSGTTDSAHMHQGTVTLYSYPFTFPNGTGPAIVDNGDVESQDTTHDHTVSVADFTPDIYRRRMRLCKKVNGDSDLLPATALAFGKAGIVGLLSQRTGIYSGRLLCIGDTVGNAGVSNPSIAEWATVSTVNKSHIHGDGPRPAVDLNGKSPVYNHATAGIHSHTVNDFSIRLKRQQLAAYGSTSDAGFAIRPGMIAFWDGDLGSLPPDWYLADGTNGTINLVDRFIEFAGDGELAEPEGDNTVAITGQTSPHSHGHKGGALDSRYYAAVNKWHESATHRHNVNMIKNWQPEWYALAAIQYMPEA